MLNCFCYFFFKGSFCILRSEFILLLVFGFEAGSVLIALFFTHLTWVCLKSFHSYLSYLLSSASIFFFFLVFFFLFFFPFPLSTAPRSLHSLSFSPLFSLWTLTDYPSLCSLHSKSMEIYLHNNVGNVVWRCGLLIRNCKQFLEFGLNI